MELRNLFSATEANMKKAVEATDREFGELKTGRANPKMVEGIHVSYYGTPTLLKEIASISVPEARLIVIHPWDPHAISDIEKAILQSNLGITPSNDGKIIRLSVPQLSTERRADLVKIVKKIAEEGKVSIRTVRKEANENAKALEKTKKISEDERFRAQDDVQKLTDSYTKKIDALLESKEKELREF